MFDFQANLTLVTTNQTVNSKGCLVMGRGAALGASRRYTDCARRFGEIVAKLNKHCCLPYGIITIPVANGILGAFQVKEHWSDNASLDLIRFSTCKLNYLIRHAFPRNIVISLNYPGIGNGRLTKDKVFPIINTLPDNVIVWTEE